MNNFSIKESISFGWETFKARPWLFVGAQFVMFIISFLINLPGNLLEGMDGVAAVLLMIIVTIVAMVLSFLLDMGKTAFFLHSHDVPTGVSIRDLWHPQPFWKYVGASILSGILIILGLILLIIPGIIVAIMVAFSTYIVIDTGLGPWAAIKRSAEITKGHRWHLFRLGLVLFGLNILGFVALLVGLLVTVPVSVLAVVHVYRALSGSAASPTPAVEPASTPVVA
jgi:uncharacterized membrane protein